MPFGVLGGQTLEQAGGQGWGRRRSSVPPRLVGPQAVYRSCAGAWLSGRVAERRRRPGRPAARSASLNLRVPVRCSSRRRSAASFCVDVRPSAFLVRVRRAHRSRLRHHAARSQIGAPGILAGVRPLDGPHEPDERPACWRCGRPTYDPDKRSVPWARAVVGGRQVLICPACQAEPGWARRPGPVRLVRRHAAVDPARRCGVSSVRSHRASGRLAQLEERRPYKAKVGGSSPSAPTTNLQPPPPQPVPAF